MVHIVFTPYPGFSPFEFGGLYIVFASYLLTKYFPENSSFERIDGVFLTFRHTLLLRYLYSQHVTSINHLDFLKKYSNAKSSLNHFPISIIP